MQTVKCLKDAGRLEFKCTSLVDREGVSLPFGKHLGELRPGLSADLMDFAAEQYISAVDAYNLRPESLDAALVDGRLRSPVALKLLNLLSPHATLVVHDFWSRLDHSSAISSYNWNPRKDTPKFKQSYGIVLKYYDVLGRDRTVAILRPKPVAERPIGWETAWKEYIDLW
jgi:hypothetical protein